MHVILALASLPLASGSSGFTSLDAIAWIGIPLFIFFCGAAFAGIKGAIRFAQYMVRSEEAQDSTASTNIEIRDKLNTFIEKTDRKLGIHDQELAVLRWITGSNGHPKTPDSPSPYPMRFEEDDDHGTNA
jgi:hypothetical protein